VPVSLVFTSDTHVPKRSRDVPHSLWTAIEVADVVVHAGDWVDAALLDLFEARSRRLIGVYGNNDHGTLRERLPEVARAEIEGIRIAVVHETGDRKGREERCAARFPDADLLVFGHSHIPWDTTARTGLRLLNPGSPTDRRRQPHGTFVTAVADGGTLLDVTFHAIPQRA
jgi:putative phosphoesterase